MAKGKPKPGTDAAKPAPAGEIVNGRVVKGPKVTPQPRRPPTAATRMNTAISNRASAGVPRQLRMLNGQQRRFVFEYLTDFDRKRAYRAAGYKPKDDASANVGAYRLLRDSKVQELIDQIQSGRLKRLSIDADWVLLRFKRVYLECMNSGDSQGATQALVNIAKHVGFYAEHNKQKAKNMTPADVEELKRELRENGFDLGKLGAGNN